MTELLLTHGYFLMEDPKELQIMKPYPPMGILYLCSHLQAKGYSIEVFDSTFSKKQELIDRLHSDTPSILGIYANLMTRPNVVQILKEAKQAGWTTIVGGPEPGAYVDEYLQEGADIVVMGEGELTVEEILEAFRQTPSPDLSKIPGLAFREPSGFVHRTAQRAQIADIDAQPWPARESIDTSRYVETWRKHHGTGSVSIITARGCPYRCQWCSHQVFGQTHRRRKPHLVADELAWIRERYQPDMLWIADDVFTINHGWLEEWSKQVHNRGLRIPFECISRADRLNEQIIATLADLGCFRIWIGSESGSQRLLDSMQRGVKVEAVREAIALCRRYGIQTGMFLMWGYEGEELEDIEATIHHVRTSNPDIFFTTVSYPIKGTPYYKNVESRLVQLKPWAQTSDRELEIRGRRSREFYRVADQLLRHEVELSRLQSSGTQPETQAHISDLAKTIQEERSILYSSPEGSIAS